MMDDTLVVHPAEEGGFWAEVASLDGCFVWGETVEEVLADAPAAIAAHVAALRAHGQPVPGPVGVMLATVRAPTAAVA